MKRTHYLYIALLALLSLSATAAVQTGRMNTRNLAVTRAGDKLQVAFDLVLDSMKLRSNHQYFVTPVITDGTNSVSLPSVMVNGRNMQYAWQRGVLRKLKDRYTLDQVVRRDNGKPQTVSYLQSVAMQPWMMDPKAGVELVVDTCGCGSVTPGNPAGLVPLNLNPALQMRYGYITPEVTAPPVDVHEGKARVQFEVDRTELHAQPYVCKSGQRIDNRAQLQAIDDTVQYALTDPNVEIANIAITGYASPESPYTHNDYLATNRSRALAEYLAQRYRLPADRTSYGSVPENWGEFRQQVLGSKEITAQQRADLLALIDRPAYGPADYDAKEKELKTSPKFAKLYKSLILPVWFPQLRATKFAISTRLKPLSDQELAKVMATTPGKMSLNQMFRVARLYPEGSDDFNRAMKVALEYYPDSPVANLNAAVALMKAGDYTAAAPLLEKAGDSPEANNARGVLATDRGDYEAARRYFQAAGSLPEAVKNLNLLP